MNEQRVKFFTDTFCARPTNIDEPTLRIFVALKSRWDSIELARLILVQVRVGGGGGTNIFRGVFHLIIIAAATTSPLIIVNYDWASVM